MHVKFLDRATFWCYGIAMTSRLREFLQSLFSGSLVPLFALGMGVEIQSVESSFFQNPPSAEEVASDTLQERHEVSPADSLKSLPGVTLIGSEVTTYSSSLFLRGADSDHTLFVWNDFRSDNFTSPAGATDPFGLSAEFSNRLRVLKGPQSLLYGTQALGGVILVEHDPDLDSLLEIAGGSLHTSRGLGEIRYRKNKLQMALGASAFNSGGLSSYNADLPRGEGSELERDGRQKDSASLIASLDLPSEDQLQVMVNSLHDSLRDDVPPLDDINASSENRSLQWKLRYKAHWGDKVDSGFLLTHQKMDRESQNPADIYNPDSYLSQIRGERQIFINRNNFHFWNSAWQLGFEFSRESAVFAWSSTNPIQTSSFSPQAEEQSLYLVNNWIFQEADFSWGLRGSCLDSKDCQTVQQLSYQRHWGVDQRSIYGILSSGLKRPSLYQLHAPGVEGGNPDLESENSRAYEVGIVQRWGAMQRLRFSVFDNSFSDLIYYDFGTSKFNNINKAKSRGLELLHQIENVLWDSQLSLAQIEAKDENTQLRLLRRPAFQGSWNFAYNVVESFQLRNELIYLGEREDVIAPNQRVSLGAVMLWNAVAIYKAPYGHYFVRVNNLTNTFYETIRKYKAPGRFVWLGLSLHF